MTKFPQPSPMNPNDLGLAPEVMMEKPNTYLVWAILATLCCCLPTGIVAIIYAAQVDSKWEGGNWAGSREASDQAKMWSLISLGLGIVFSIVYFFLMSTGEMGGSTY